MKIVLPYVTTPMDKVDKMVSFACVQPGQKSVDLGAGDGRIVIAMAKAGARAYGFETIQKYVRRAKTNIRREHVENRASISQADFWQEDLASFDIVTVYAMEAFMIDLGLKFTRELRSGTIVISNGFKIPKWRSLKEEDHLYFYITD